MGGTWETSDITSVTTRPGAYFNLIARATDLLTAGDRGTVLIVGRADWGPLGEDEIVDVTSEGGADTAFGTTLSLPKLIKQALRGGAAVVRGMRIAADSAAEAEVTLDDDYVADPALDLTAKYTGSRANNFTITVLSHPVDGLFLDLKEGTTRLERYHSLVGTNSDFAVQINEQSKYLTAEVNGTEDRVLEIAADQPMTGGDSGATVVAGDYVDAQSILEGADFDVYVQDDDIDTANQDASGAWAASRREEGQRFILVMGSEDADVIDTAMVRAADQDNESVVYVFPGFTDDAGVFYNGQEAAARVAGLIAAAGMTHSITFATVEGAVEVETKLTGAEIGVATAAGLCLLVADGPEVRVERGVNTFTSEDDDPTKTKAWRKIRTIATLDALVEGLESGFRSYIGNATNDEDTRESMVGAGQEFLDQLIQARAINPGAFIILDPDNPPTLDQVFLVVGVTPLDSVEEIFVTVNVAA